MLTLKEQVKQLQDKATDIKSRLCRNNLCMLGLIEKAEGLKLYTFLILKKVSKRRKNFIAIIALICCATEGFIYVMECPCDLP